jgi:hypothetical protein
MSRRRFVLIVAVAQYADNSIARLPGVLRDPERFRSTLELTADGGVHRLHWLCDGRATRQEVLDKLAEIRREASATDQVVIYFAGHGWRQRDETATGWKYYLIPYDATLAAAAEQGIAIDDLRIALGTLPAQELVLILDCCHSGGMVNSFWTSQILEELLQGWRSHYVMAASRGYEKAGEDETGGFFTKALCDALSGNGVMPDEMGRISAQKAWSQAADLVKARAGGHGHQQLAVSSGISTPIYLTCVQRNLELVRRKLTNGLAPPGQAAASQHDGYAYCAPCGCAFTVPQGTRFAQCPKCGMSIRTAGAEVEVFGQSAEEVLSVAQRMAESLLHHGCSSSLDRAEKAVGDVQRAYPQKRVPKRWWEFWK